MLQFCGGVSALSGHTKAERDIVDLFNCNSDFVPPMVEFSIGRATMSAKLGSEDGEELQNVLGRMSKDDRNAVMLRVALRQLPYICRLSALSGSENVKARINQTFRSVIVARVAIANKGLGNTARAELGACANGLRFAEQSSFNLSDGLGGSALDDEPVILANSALASVRAALETITANDATLSHQSHILQLALRGGGDKAVYADLRQIQDEPSIDLIGLPLWLDDVREDEQKRANIPPAERDAFDKFAMTGIGAKQPWSIWVEWYRGILPNGPNLDPHDIFSTASLRSFLRLPDAFWFRDPGEVAKTVSDLRRSPSLADEWMSRAVTPEPQGDESRTANNDFKSRPSETPQMTDETRGNRDAPTTEDRLGRRPFAHKLVDLIEGLKADTEAFDFAIHMHAPWGVGKSSVIAMMTEILQDRTRKDAENWAVFTFNAWEHEHRRLPWWPFLSGLRKASLKEKWRRGARIKSGWTCIWWRTRRVMDFAGPFLLAIASIAGLFWLMISQGTFVSGEAGVEWAKIVSFIAGGTALVVTLTSLGRRLIFGAEKQADFYFSLSRNPWQRVRNRFRHLAGGLARPVCIFIDDLDRCQTEYVVDVLTGIQTHFRKDNVVYVVAADRKWLRTSFETAYKDFVHKSGQKEDRLGYLFLEKVFQLSVPLPRIPAYYREAYFHELLNDEEAMPEAGSVEDRAAFDAEMEARRQAAFSRSTLHTTCQKRTTPMRVRHCLLDRPPRKLRGKPSRRWRRVRPRKRATRSNTACGT